MTNLDCRQESIYFYAIQFDIFPPKSEKRKKKEQCSSVDRLEIASNEFQGNWPPWSNSIGFVLELGWFNLVEIFEQCFGNQSRMDCSDSIDGMGAHHSKISHANLF